MKLITTAISCKSSNPSSTNDNIWKEYQFKNFDKSGRSEKFSGWFLVARDQWTKTYRSRTRTGKKLEIWDRPRTKKILNLGSDQDQKSFKILEPIRIRRFGDPLIWLSIFGAQTSTGRSIADRPNGQKDLYWTVHGAKTGLSLSYLLVVHLNLTYFELDRVILVSVYQTEFVGLKF